MNLIIHDLENNNELEASEGSEIIAAKMMCHDCRGCFNCWTRTPGECVIKDGFDTIGKRLSNADEVTIISKCVYGSVSPDIKRVIDRSIGYSHPFFLLQKNEMHHKRRYQNRFALNIHFYGKISDQEKETAKRCAEMLKTKYGANSLKLKFEEDKEMI